MIDLAMRTCAVVGSPLPLANCQREAREGLWGVRSVMSSSFPMFHHRGADFHRIPVRIRFALSYDPWAQRQAPAFVK
jgi:hypothetical protein